MRGRGFGRGRDAERHQSGLGHRYGGVQIFGRVGFELLQAGRAAKVVIFSAMGVDMFGDRRIHIHSADGIAFERGG